MLITGTRAVVLRKRELGIAHKYNTLMSAAGQLLIGEVGHTGMDSRELGMSERIAAMYADASTQTRSALSDSSEAGM